MIQFKYTHLPSFCFIYGMLGHTDKLSGKLLQLQEGEVKKEWGLWLRATPKRSSCEDGGLWLRDSNSQWVGGDFDSYTLQFQGYKTTEHYGTVTRVYSRY